jgi:hypothetical protein
MTENECLTSIAQLGASPVFLRRIQAALATLAAEQREPAVQYLAWVLGKDACPQFVTVPPVLERSAHEAPYPY